jgi:hypothetical protein
MRTTCERVENLIRASLRPTHPRIECGASPVRATP